jgi:hypothetical protein
LCSVPICLAKFPVRRPEMDEALSGRLGLR